VYGNLEIFYNEINKKIQFTVTLSECKTKKYVIYISYETETRGGRKIEKFQ